jgi:hypothetical protein
MEVQHGLSEVEIERLYITFKISTGCNVNGVMLMVQCEWCNVNGVMLMV